MDSLGEALESSGGAMPEIAAVVRLLTDNAGLALTVVLVALLLIVVLAEIFQPERRAAAEDERGRTLGR